MSDSVIDLEHSELVSLHVVNSALSWSSSELSALLEDCGASLPVDTLAELQCSLRSALLRVQNVLVAHGHSFPGVV